VAFFLKKITQTTVKTDALIEKNMFKPIVERHTDRCTNKTLAQQNDRAYGLPDSVTQTFTMYRVRARMTTTQIGAVVVQIGR
jgi:hypothetical protein